MEQDFQSGHQRLDDPGRIHQLRQVVAQKPFLRQFYLEIYQKYARCLAQCPPEGVALELGSGASFVKEIIPEMVTSDTLPYEGVDRVVDATAMPFESGALRGIFMTNVFHHIPRVDLFLAEAQRCLKPGGRVYIFDQYPGFLATPLLRYAHHEPFHPESNNWDFPSTGPLSGANGALAWMVFERDRRRFETEYPGLRLMKSRSHSPTKYWLSGGLSSPWGLPGWMFKPVSAFDGALMALGQRWGSFYDVELLRVDNSTGGTSSS